MNFCRALSFNSQGQGIMTLKDLKIGKSAIVSLVGGMGALRQHFLDMGIIPGSEITVVKYAPMGDTCSNRAMRYRLGVRGDSQFNRLYGRRTVFIITLVA